MRNAKAERLFNQGFVQHGIGRALHLGRKLVAVAGLDVAGRMAGVFRYGFGKVVPGADALVGIVLYAGGGVPSGRY